MKVNITRRGMRFIWKTMLLWLNSRNGRTVSLKEAKDIWKISREIGKYIILSEPDEIKELRERFKI